MLEAGSDFYGYWSLRVKVKEVNNPLLIVIIGLIVLVG